MELDNKQRILHLFYVEHLKVKDIASKIKLSSPYITKVVKQDDRYCTEKQVRKEISHNNRKKAQNQFIKEKREKRRLEDNYQLLQEQHKQASRELSKSSHLSNENYRKWNSSAYQYNPSKKRYEFRENLGRSNDVPKYIKEKI